MKKFTKINYILTFILVFCIGATLPILIGSSHVDEQHSAKSEVPYCVTSPTVPEQVTFDGETIDLRRYDRRERMDREMMASGDADTKLTLNRCMLDTALSSEAL